MDGKVRKRDRREGKESQHEETKALKSLYMPVILITQEGRQEDHELKEGE